MSLLEHVSPASRRAHLMVPESAAILKRLYFLYRELVMMQAAWLPGCEPWECKLLLPEVLWQDSQIAASLRDRVLELRYPLRQIDVAPDESLLSLWRRLADAPNATAFCRGVAEVASPLLHKTITDYLARTDHLDDGPSVRVLVAAQRDLEQRESRWAAAVADARSAYPEHAADADPWVAGLGEWRTQLGDLLSQDRPTPTFDPAACGGRPRRISRTGLRDKRFDVMRFGWPDMVDPGFGAGEGLQLQLRQAVHHLNEVWAAEMAAACLFDLADDAEFAFFVDAARWCYDEIRHCRMGYARLREWGFAQADMPIGNFSYDAGADVDPITRLGIIFYFESTYIHTKSQRMILFNELGDQLSSHDMDFDWADEQIHAHYGATWLNYLLKKSGDSRKPMEFRSVSESCIARIRGTATDADLRATHAAFDRLMASPQAAGLGRRIEGASGGDER